MGPAVTLEKTNIGAKRYLPLPQVMPRLVQSTRRHSGSISGHHTTEKNLKQPQVVKNLRRQWSFDCVLGRGRTVSALEDEHCFLNNVSESKNCDKSLIRTDVLDLGNPEYISKTRASSCRSIRCDGVESSPLECPTTPYKEFIVGPFDNTADKEMGPHNAEVDQTTTKENRNCKKISRRSPQLSSGDESTSSTISSSSFHDAAVNIIHDLESNNDKLTQRASVLLRRAKHVHKKGMRNIFEKYLHQLQVSLKKQGMSFKASTLSSSDSNSLASESLTNISCDAKNLHDDLKFEENLSIDSLNVEDPLLRNVVNMMSKSVDPDATEDSSDEGGSEEEILIRESDEVAERVELASRWRRLEQRVRVLDEEIMVSGDRLKKMRSEHGDDGDGWMVRGSPESTKLVFSRPGAARCLPYSRWKRRKLISINRGNSCRDVCHQCASERSAPSFSSPQFPLKGDAQDPFQIISQSIWKKWSSSLEQRQIPPQVSRSTDLPSDSFDFSSSSEFCYYDNSHESKSTTRVQNLFSNKREWVKPSSNRTAGDLSRKSNFGINDVIMLPTNPSSTRLCNSFTTKKEIDVPTWRYVSCHLIHQENEVEDTSDEAYVRRHLQPEITERRHRIPEVISKSRRFHGDKRITNLRRRTTGSSFDSDESKSRRSDRCRIRSEKESSSVFDWSSISHHSDDFHVDDKSLDGISWVSTTNACASSDLSLDSNLPRDDLLYRGDWNRRCGDRLENFGASNDSCSTASACSPSNP